jgi:hypothetical protein
MQAYRYHSIQRLQSLPVMDEIESNPSVLLVFDEYLPFSDKYNSKNLLKLKNDFKRAD